MRNMCFKKEKNERETPKRRVFSVRETIFQERQNMKNKIQEKLQKKKKGNRQNRVFFLAREKKKQNKIVFLQKFTRIQKNAKKVKERENKETVKDPEFFENSEKKKKVKETGEHGETKNKWREDEQQEEVKRQRRQDKMLKRSFGRK